MNILQNRTKNVTPPPTITDDSTSVPMEEEEHNVNNATTASSSDDLRKERGEKRKDLVRQSWALLEKRLGSTGVKLFYDTLFVKYPATKKMFDNTNMYAQYTKLYGVLQVAVRSLDHMEELVPILKELGRRHAVAYGVEKKHYAAITDTFVCVMKDFLLSEDMLRDLGIDDASSGIFAIEIVDAWEWALNSVGAIMASGAIEETR